MIVTFRDWDPWYRVDETGYNKIGFVTKSKMVLYPRRTSLTWVPLKKIEKYRNTFYKLIEIGRDASVEKYFTENRPHVGLFFQGVHAYINGNFSIFESPIKLPILRPLRPEEFTKKWLEFESALRPGDMIMTLDTKSTVSRCIAAIDHGTWSHVALYRGERQVYEAILDGVVMRNLDSYNSIRYRVGAYRLPGGVPPYKVDAIMNVAKSEIGARYAYGKVIKLGIKKLFLPPMSLGPADMSPNDLAIHLQLVSLV